MKILDLGHKYEVAGFDGGAAQTITFMKREGDGYPFNVGHYGGTNCQELLRVLIDRVQYLDKQISCPENTAIINSLRTALLLFESRAAQRHERSMRGPLSDIEAIPPCPKCGHLQCAHMQSRSTLGTAQVCGSGRAVKRVGALTRQSQD